MVIFGAGGDLTKRLVVPALYNLARSGVLPENFALIGVDLAAQDRRTVARQPQRHAEELRRQQRRGIRRRRIDQEAWKRLADTMTYIAGRFHRSRTLRGARERAATRRKRPTARRAMRSSTWPSPTGSSAPWSTQLGKAGLTEQSEDTDGKPHSGVAS